MLHQKTTFALFFGNRGFFPSSLIASAREEMRRTLEDLGYGVLMLDVDATRYGAVETPQEGEVYARFLEAHRGEYGGVILCLPNFGDETGAVAALRNACTPILIQAYSDELDKMAPALRRDAFCGKISIMDVFNQYGVRFTALKPHTVSPSSERFVENIAVFDGVCRVYNGVKDMVVGAIGARTTAFKTVRIDEITLQRHGITVETLDLSDVFRRMKSIETKSDDFKAKEKRLVAYASWQGVPEAAFQQIVRLGVVLDQLIEEFRLNALAIRCWQELQLQIGASPCVLLGELNSRGIAAACEVDIGNAVAMRALSLASEGPPACLDWNNNYADEDDKCILFHCGPVPAELMAGQGKITDNPILATSIGAGCSFGCNVGRIAPGAFTFGGLMTESGKIKMYTGEGKFTTDPIPADFFGCAGVAQIDGLQDVLLHIGRQGHRHHVSIAPGQVQAPVQEALGNYLGFEMAKAQPR